MDSAINSNMDSATDPRQDNSYHGSHSSERQRYWNYLKDIWAADSMAELGQAIKNLMKAVPVWGLVIFFGVLAVMVNSSIILVPLAAGGFLVGMFFTVKHAILSALREYDSRKS